MEDDQKVNAGIQKSILILHLFRIGNYGPWIILLKKKQIQPLKFQFITFEVLVIVIISNLKFWPSPNYY